MSDDYQRVAAAIHYLQSHASQQPSLERIASQVGLSPFHFQRLFQRWAGVSPKRFLQQLTAVHARKLLEESRPVLEASFAVGLSGPGRLHDLLLAVEAVTPGELKTGGFGLTIRFGVHPTPFGDCFLGLTGKGVCRLEFVAETGSAASLESLRRVWPEAVLREDQAATARVVERIFPPGSRPAAGQLSLLLRGTNFQLQVWQALLRIPEGRVTSYGFLAEQLGLPGASRAVGTAVGQNPIGYLIPCHRVLRQSGALGGYRWGLERKQALLGRELVGVTKGA